jgi:hypothetical protein
MFLCDMHLVNHEGGVKRQNKKQKIPLNHESGKNYPQNSMQLAHIDRPTSAPDGAWRYLAKRRHRIGA